MSSRLEAGGVRSSCFEVKRGDLSYLYDCYMRLTGGFLNQPQFEALYETMKSSSLESRYPIYPSETINLPFAQRHACSITGKTFSLERCELAAIKEICSVAGNSQFVDRELIASVVLVNEMASAASVNGGDSVLVDLTRFRQFTNGDGMTALQVNGRKKGLSRGVSL